MYSFTCGTLWHFNPYRYREITICGDPSVPIARKLLKCPAISSYCPGLVIVLSAFRSKAAHFCRVDFPSSSSDLLSTNTSKGYTTADYASCRCKPQLSLSLSMKVESGNELPFEIWSIQAKYINSPMEPSVHYRCIQEYDGEFHY